MSGKVILLLVLLGLMLCGAQAQGIGGETTGHFLCLHLGSTCYATSALLYVIIAQLALYIIYFIIYLHCIHIY